MKIALLYSGQPRNIEDTFDNHVQNFWIPNSDCDIDVFSHMWHDENLSGTYFWDRYPQRGVWRNDLVDLVYEKWNPIDCIFEKPKTFNIDGVYPDPRFPHPLNNTLSMFYGMSQVSKLKRMYEDKNNFKYDAVIRLRTDCYFINNTMKPISNYDLNFVNVRGLLDPHTPHALVDHFAFSSSSNMDLFLDVYDNIMEIIDMGAEINPECLLGFNAIHRHNLSIKESVSQRDLIMYRDVCL